MKDLNIYELFRVQRTFLTDAISIWLQSAREAVRSKQNFLTNNDLSIADEEMQQ